MEAKLIYLHNKGRFSSIGVHRNLTHKREYCSPVVLAVLTRPRENNIKVTDTTPTVYNDNWFDRIAINHLSKSFQDVSGTKNTKIGYESLLDAAAVVSRSFNTNKQQELVIQTLEKAFPRLILSMIKTLLPPTKFAREYFAVFTTIFFAWLVGPCEVKETEVEGRTEKSVVHVKKCRFLEGTNCVGMCINLCKMPSQKFIKDSLGMPFTMVPNFEDMSCEMIFGQDPPIPAEDPALKQPCYKILCKAKQKHNSDCPS